MQEKWTRYQTFWLYVFRAIQGWSQLAFCGFIRDVTWVYIHICGKSFTMDLLLQVNDPQLDLPMEWVLYSSLNLKNLFKNKSTLLAFSSFEETKVWVPFVRVKRKGILVSPLRPLPTDKNGLCTFPQTPVLPQSLFFLLNIHPFHISASCGYCVRKRELTFTGAFHL